MSFVASLRFASLPVRRSSVAFATKFSTAAGGCPGYAAALAASRNTIVHALNGNAVMLGTFEVPRLPAPLSPLATRLCVATFDEAIRATSAFIDSLSCGPPTSRELSELQDKVFANGSFRVILASAAEAFLDLADFCSNLAPCMQAMYVANRFHQAVASYYRNAGPHPVTVSLMLFKWRREIAVQVEQVLGDIALGCCNPNLAHVLAAVAARHNKLMHALNGNIEPPSTNRVPWYYREVDDGAFDYNVQLRPQADAAAFDGAIVPALANAVRAVEADAHNQLMHAGNGNTSTAQDATLSKTTVEPPKSWTSWLKPTFNVSLVDKDRTLIERFKDTVSDLPGKSKAQMSDLWADVKSSFTSYGLPENLKDFIFMLSDVVVLSLSDDPYLAVAMQPRMLLQYGFLNTALIDGLTFFVKQFTKRWLQPRDQGEGDEEVKEEDTEWSLGALFSVLHYYTIGQLPTSIPKDTIKYLVGLNAGFMLVKNFEHFGVYIVRIVKATIDAIWRLLTNRPWFDQSQRETIDAMAASLSKLEQYLLVSSPTRADIDGMRRLSSDANSLMALAAARNVDKDLCAQFREAHLRFNTTIAVNSGPAQYNDPRRQAILVSLTGTSGSGKTTVTRLLAAALTRACGYSGPLGEVLTVWHSDVNFQPPLSTHCRIMQFDDVFLIADGTRYQNVIATLSTLGSTVPVLQDNPIAQLKGQEYVNIEFGVATDNVIPPDLPVNEIGAMGRRFIGGMHSIELNPEYEQESVAHFDPKKICADDATTEAELIDDAWVFTDHTGVRRKFSELVGMLLAIRAELIVGQRKLDSVVTRMASSFVAPAFAKISAPPTTLSTVKLNATREARHAGISIPARTVSVRDTLSSMLASESSPPVKNQGFSNRDSSPALAKWANDGMWSDDRNAKFLDRMARFLQADESEYVFENGVMTKAGAVVTAASLRALFCTDPPPGKINIDVPPSDWTTDVLLAMRSETFYIKGSCCRHNRYCYQHGKSICDSWDADAVSSNYVGVSHWALENAAVPSTSLAYHRLVHAAYTPVQDHFALRVLKGVATALAAGTTGYIIGMLLSKIYSSFFRARAQAYSHAGASLSKKVAGQSIVRPTFGPVKDQASKTDANAWILGKIEDASVPFTVTKGTKRLDLHLLRLAGNVAICPRHAFFEGAEFAHIGGSVAQTLPLRLVATPKDLVNGPWLQYTPDRHLDLAWVVLPTSLAPCNSIVKYLIPEETAVSQLTGVILAARAKPGVTFGPDKKVEPELLAPLHEFPLGDASGAHSYTSSAHFQGVFIKCAAETSDGFCGLAAYTTNTRFGRGHQKIAGIHAAFQDVTGMAIISPCPVEAYNEFISLCPAGTLNLVRAQSKLVFAATTDRLTDNILVLGSLPPSDRQFQNSKSNIVRSPLYDCLVGLEIDNPISGEKEVIAEPNVAPAPVREVLPALAKVVKHNFTPTPFDHASYKESVQATKDQILRFCDPRLVEPQDAIFSTFDAINGVADLGIPGLDMRKSPGYFPPHKPGHLGRSYWAEQREDGWHALPHLDEAVEKIISDWMKGKMHTPFVVGNTKVELRPLAPTEVVDPLTEEVVVVDKVKYARMTGCYGFPYTVAKRRLTMHVPAMIISGRGSNGMSFGADLNGPDGTTAATAGAQFNRTSSVDAKNYDASKGSYFSEPAEEVVVDFALMRFPFLSRESARCAVVINRIVYVVIGGLVYWRYHGMQSGDTLTTVLNCIDSSSTGREAWKRSDPPPGHSFDTHVFSQAYGDDFRARHSHEGFTGSVITSTGKRLGITYTPVSKAAEATDFVQGVDDVHLKRSMWQDACGRWHAPLKVDTVNHIHAFYHRRDIDPSAAITQNADSALREWFHYGPRVFAAVKQRLNDRLRANHLRTVSLDYDELYQDWFNNFPGSRMTHMGYARAQSASQESVASSSIGDSVTSSKVNPDSEVQTSSTSGITTQAMLTKHVDISTLSTTTRPPGVSISSITPLNPYPPLGVEKVLEREYPLLDITWPTTSDFPDRLADFSFPEDMFAIPNIAEKLGAFRYFRADLELTVRVNGNQFVGGALQLAFLPDHVEGGANAWRSDPYLCPNVENWMVSAAKSTAVKFLLPWSSPFSFYDIVDDWPHGGIGKLFVDVAAKLSWMSASPPTGLNVTIWARFINMQLSGPNINAGPSAARRMRMFKGATHKGAARDQSAISEAIEKATKGVESIVSSTVKAFAGVGDVAALVGGLLDKPLEVVNTQRVRFAGATDMPHTDGVANSVAMSTRTMPYVSIRNNLMAEDNPQPIWADVLGIPGYIGRFTWGDEVKGTVLYQTLIFPTKCFEVNSQTYVPTPLAYWAMRHLNWRGSFKVMIRLFGPSVQKGQLRVTWIPSMTASTGVANNIVGDLETATYDVEGDRDIMFSIPFNSAIPVLDVCSPKEITPTSYQCTGRIAVQVVSPLSSQTVSTTENIQAIVYLAADTDFVLSCPVGLFGNFAPGLEVSTPPPRTVRISDVTGANLTTRSTAPTRTQACVRDLFGPAFNALSPSKKTLYTNISDPDRTRGPVDLMKRFTYVETVNTTAGGFFYDSTFWPSYETANYDILPFMHWSGSRNFKFIPTGTEFPGTGFTYCSAVNLDNVDDRTKGAFTQVSNAQEPILSVTFPFQGNVPAREVYDDHGYETLSNYSVKNVPSGTSPAIASYDIWSGVGDDFSVYHFCCPPFLIYTPPAGPVVDNRTDRQKRAAERVKRLKSSA